MTPEPSEYLKPRWPPGNAKALDLDDLTKRKEAVNT